MGFDLFSRDHDHRRRDIAIEINHMTFRPCLRDWSGMFTIPLLENKGEVEGVRVSIGCHGSGFDSCE